MYVCVCVCKRVGSCRYVVCLVACLFVLTYMHVNELLCADLNICSRYEDSRVRFNVWVCADT